jgi:hypothetical protein
MVLLDLAHATNDTRHVFASQATCVPGIGQWSLLDLLRDVQSAGHVILFIACGQAPWRRRVGLARRSSLLNSSTVSRHSSVTHVTGYPSQGSRLALSFDNDRVVSRQGHSRLRCYVNLERNRSDFCLRSTPGS